MFAFIVSSCAPTGHTGDDAWEHWAFVALEKAEQIFDPKSESEYITSPAPQAYEVRDNRRSFVVLPGGAEDPAERAEFARWLAAQRREDDSPPLQWVEVEFGLPHGAARVVSSG